MNNDVIYLLVKFGTKENIDKMQKGIIYCKNLEYYHNLYWQKKDKDMGDPYEGRYIGKLKNKNIELVIDDTNKIPIFCMYGLKRSDIRDYNNFNPMEKFKDMVNKNYWQSALIITDQVEFFNRMRIKCNENNIKALGNIVEYIDINLNSEERLIKYLNNPSKIAFWKDDYYINQYEYRFVFYEERVEDDFVIDIGDISDISKVYYGKELFDFIEDEYRIVDSQIRTVEI
ncbi:hypothetical protein PMY38_07700 [Clostridium tertium]|uniref:hypothetical protein n=1 Tax=Clostridium tertium TaxID=1559 RepID=UPI00232EA300|nr:hypothetical protein [Clostridium tertium]MBS6503856.1 hypothetical protein [Clostridium sp.]MDB1956605.1 hypothetical protein [Clostridium tertium]MDB1958476.1 hypothetical protein [Clostridium tertium]MDB1962367.1 hypothetical protein [Clostridium tertium]MDB1967657.1 hypothetical protein [Clostridium tertium]